MEVISVNFWAPKLRTSWRWHRNLRFWDAGPTPLAQCVTPYTKNPRRLSKTTLLRGGIVEKCWKNNLQWKLVPSGAKKNGRQFSQFTRLPPAFFALLAVCTKSYPEARAPRYHGVLKRRGFCEKHHRWGQEIICHSWPAQDLAKLSPIPPALSEMPQRCDNNLLWKRCGHCWEGGFFFGFDSRKRKLFLEVCTQNLGP